MKKVHIPGSVIFGLLLVAVCLFGLLQNASETTSRNILHLRNMLTDYSEVFLHTFNRRPLIADLLPELEEWINYYALNIIQEIKIIYFIKRTIN